MESSIKSNGIKDRISQVRNNISEGTDWSIESPGKLKNINRVKSEINSETDLQKSRITKAITEFKSTFIVQISSLESTMLQKKQELSKSQLNQVEMIELATSENKTLSARIALHETNGPIPANVQTKSTDMLSEIQTLTELCASQKQQIKENWRSIESKGSKNS